MTSSRSSVTRRISRRVRAPRKSRSRTSGRTRTSRSWPRTTSGSRTSSSSRRSRSWRASTTTRESIASFWPSTAKGSSAFPAASRGNSINSFSPRSTRRRRSSPSGSRRSSERFLDRVTEQRHRVAGSWTPVAVDIARDQCRQATADAHFLRRRVARHSLLHQHAEDARPAKTVPEARMPNLYYVRSPEDVQVFPDYTDAVA